MNLFFHRKAAVPLIVAGGVLSGCANANGSPSTWVLGGASATASASGSITSASGAMFSNGGTLGDVDAAMRGGSAPPCTGDGWDCKIDPCDGGPKTTVTAKVYDPAGQNPLYNVAVYVPNGPLSPISSGPTCDNCATPVSGNPVASALTDASGQFHMVDVPVGENVPLVIQIGKWRRAIVLPAVKACQDNPFDDPSTFRLPHDQTEGNVPRILIATGDADTPECLLRRIGVADTEFTNPGGGGRVNLYVNDIGTSGGTTAYSSGASFPTLTTLLGPVAAPDASSSAVDSFGDYDIVMMSCQGSESAGDSVTTPEKQALKTFVDSGGRAFFTHYSYSWLRSDAKYLPSPFPPVATWSASGGDGTYLVDTSFPRGSAMADWLVNVGASTTHGQIALVNVKDPAISIVTGTAQQWVYQPTKGVPYLSANTPIELAATPSQQCGRIVHTGIHVASTQPDSHSPFPKGCAVGGLSPQEKALEFLLFDLSSCVTDETQPPPPPTPVR